MSDDVEVYITLTNQSIDKKLVCLVVEFLLSKGCDYNVSYEGRYLGIKSAQTTWPHVEPKQSNSSKPLVDTACFAVGHEGGGSISLGRLLDSFNYPMKLLIIKEDARPICITFSVKVGIAFDNKKIFTDMKMLASQLAQHLKEKRYKVIGTKTNWEEGDLLK